MFQQYIFTGGSLRRPWTAGGHQKAKGVTLVVVEVSAMALKFFYVQNRTMCVCIEPFVMSVWPITVTFLFI